MIAHPLDPLSAAEIRLSTRVVRQNAGLDESAWFETITLAEPEKAQLLNTGNNLAAGRRAYICCYEPSTNRTYQGVVHIDKGELVSWKHIPGAQARIVAEEFAAADKLVKADQRFRKACALRGITDLDQVLVESWAAGNYGLEEEQGQRIAYCYCWLSNDAGDNRYGRPIGNLHPVVDLRRGEVIRIDDFGVIDIPADTAAIRATHDLRTDIKPLDIIQPDGPGFSVNGYAVEWQKWKLRVGFDIREGLVLHSISYRDKHRDRPIMQRVSMPEMVVPYGDPSPGNFRRNAFDTGEYGIGQALDSLTLGCDCLGQIHYFDVCSHDWNGNAVVKKNAICMHEEDYGLLWKHTDTQTGKTRSVRSRRLVISSICTIGNYVYGFYYYFYQDGTIGVEVKATGIPFPTAIAAGEASRYGAIIAPGIQSHVHQHVFCFRFDMCVDGQQNSVSEVEFSSPDISANNPHGNEIKIHERTLRSETEAHRQINLNTARYWKVLNTNSLNALGQPVAYRLAPGTNALPFLHPDSSIAKRAGFMFKHFWATQYEATERYPAGWYPNQSAGMEGLPQWIQADRSLENTDVVIWYTLNFHHLPRPEDWPVQPVVYAGFHWHPYGFFDENPALDVPPNKPAH